MGLESGIVIYTSRANSCAGSSWANFFQLASTRAQNLGLCPSLMVTLAHTLSMSITIFLSVMKPIRMLLRPSVILDLLRQFFVRYFIRIPCLFMQKISYLLFFIYICTWTGFPNICLSKVSSSLSRYFIAFKDSWSKESPMIKKKGSKIS